MLKEGLKEGPDTAAACGEVLLCAGLSSGLVRVWKVVLEQDRCVSFAWWLLTGVILLTGVL